MYQLFILYGDPDVINYPKIFHDKGSQLTPTPAAVPFNTEDSDNENPEGILILLEPQPTQAASQYIRHLYLWSHTTTPLWTQAQNLRRATTWNPALPTTKGNQDVSSSELTQSAVSPNSFDVPTEAQEPVIDFPVPTEPITGASHSDYNLSHNPMPRNSRNT